MSSAAGPQSTEASDLARQGRVGIAAALFGVFLFGVGPAFVADATSDGLTVAFWRNLMALGVPAAICMKRGQLNRAVFRHTIVTGLAFGTANALFFTALQNTSVANATLIGVMQPVPLIIAGYFLFNERPRGRDLAWVVLAVVGAVVMVASAKSSDTGDLKGDLLALAALLFVATYFTAGKFGRRHLDTIPFITGMWFWATVSAFVILVLSSSAMLPETGLDWWRIAAVAALPGTGHAFLSYSHAHVSLAVVGVLQLLTPVVSSVIALWFLDQSIAGWQWVGMATVIVTLTIYTVQQSKNVAAEGWRRQSNLSAMTQTWINVTTLGDLIDQRAAEHPTATRSFSPTPGTRMPTSREGADDFEGARRRRRRSR